MKISLALMSCVLNAIIAMVSSIDATPVPSPTNSPVQTTHSDWIITTDAELTVACDTFNFATISSSGSVEMAHILKTSFNTVYYPGSTLMNTSFAGTINQSGKGKMKNAPSNGLFTTTRTDDLSKIQGSWDIVDTVADDDDGLYVDPTLPTEAMLSEEFTYALIQGGNAEFVGVNSCSVTIGSRRRLRGNI